mgnify:CR=1 FL=1
MARSGTPRRWGPTSAASPSRSTTGSSRSTRRRGCRTSARASGIRANSCRAGRSTASGAATASRSGTNPELLDDEKQDRGVTPDIAGAVPRRRRRATGARARAHFRGVRRCVLLPVARTAAACRTSTRSSRSSSDPQERARLAKVFEQGLDAVIGHVLPVSRDSRPGTRWRTGSMVPAARALLPDSRRFAGRLSAAARFACPGSARTTTHTCMSRIRWRRRAIAASRRYPPPVHGARR